MATRVRGAGVQGEYAFGRKLRDTVPVRFQIIDQKNVRNPERSLQIALVQHPGKIRQLQPSIANRARTAKTCRDNLILLLIAGGKELVHHVVEAGKLVCGKLLVADCLQPAIGKVVKLKVDLGATYITSKDHRSSRVPVESESAGAGSLAAADRSSKSASLPFAGRMICDGYVSG